MKQRLLLERLFIALLCLVTAHVGRAEEVLYAAQIGDKQYQTLTEAIAAVPTDGTATTITLLADVTGTNTTANTPDFTIPKKANVTLDLNNHTVTGSGWGSVFLSEGDFTITDNSTAKGGTITGGYAKGWNESKGMFYTSEEAQANSNVIALNSTDCNGGAVDVQGGKLTVNGGIFTKNYANRGGAIYVSDPENLAKYKALELIEIANPVEAVLNKCTITDNHTYWQGGGVGTNPYAHLIIKDGVEITNNTTCDHGGGIVVARTSVVTMDGGVVKGNTGHMGGGIYATGFFTMNGGVIEDNTAVYCTTRKPDDNTQICGGGLCVDGHFDILGKTTLNGGTIKNNRVEPNENAFVYNGAGVGCRYGAKLHLKGGVDVSGNKINNAGSESNDIQLRDGSYIVLDGDLTEDLSVNEAFDNGLVLDPNGHAHNNHVKILNANTSTVEKNGKLYATTNTSASDAVCKVVLEGSDVFYCPSIEAGLNLIGYSVDKTLTLTKDVSEVGMLEVPYGENTLDLNGHTMKGSANVAQGTYQYMLTVHSQTENRATFTVKNGTIDGNGRLGCVRINSYGKTTVKDVVFQNGTQDKTTAGAIWVDGYNDLSFENCQWKNNTSGFTSGAIYLAMGTNSIFKNCTFSGNKTKLWAGAVRVDGVAAFEDCDFEDNSCTEQNGGALFASSNSSVTIKNGSFTGNKADAGKGGAIYMDTDSSLRIEGVTINGNSASSGSAFYANGGKTIMKDVKIAGTLCKKGNTCHVSILGGKFNEEANTSADNGQFKFSNALSIGATSAPNTDDDKDVYPYVVTLGDIVLADKVAYDNDLTIDNVNVSYTRELTTKVGTIVLPFTPQPNALVKFYEFDGSEPEGDVITLHEATTVEPGKGYVFLYQGEIGSKVDLTLTAEGTTLHANTVEPNTNGAWTITGTYAKIKKNGKPDPFYYVNSKDGKIYIAQGNTSFDPYRAWATYSGPDQHKAFRMRLGDTVTGIAVVEDDGINVYTGKIYDLSGREVSVPQHGNIYIINGKEIIY